MFLPESTCSADSLTVSAHPPCAVVYIYICAHVKDPVVLVRVRWTMETLKHPACTLGWVARLCRSWLSLGDFPWEKSHKNNTVVEKKRKKFHFSFFRSLSQNTLFAFLAVPPLSQWGAADAEIKVPSGENTELKRSPFQAWSRSVYSHTCYAYCQGFLPCLILHFRSIHLHFFQNLSRIFSCVCCG